MLDARKRRMIEQIGWLIRFAIRRRELLSPDMAIPGLLLIALGGGAMLISVFLLTDVLFFRDSGKQLLYYLTFLAAILMTSFGSPGSLSNIQRPLHMLPLSHAYRANWAWFDQVVLVPGVLGLMLLPVSSTVALIKWSSKPLLVPLIAFTIGLALAGASCLSHIEGLRRITAVETGKRFFRFPIWFIVWLVLYLLFVTPFIMRMFAWFDLFSLPMWIVPALGFLLAALSFLFRAPLALSHRGIDGRNLRGAYGMVHKGSWHPRINSFPVQISAGVVIGILIAGAVWGTALAGKGLFPLPPLMVTLALLLGSYMTYWLPGVMPPRVIRALPLSTDVLVRRMAACAAVPHVVAFVVTFPCIMMLSWTYALVVPAALLLSFGVCLLILTGRLGFGPWFDLTYVGILLPAFGVVLVCFIISFLSKDRIDAFAVTAWPLIIAALLTTIGTALSLAGMVALRRLFARSSAPYKFAKKTEQSLMGRGAPDDA
jgi:hypothetical protein